MGNLKQKIWSWVMLVVILVPFLQAGTAGMQSVKAQGESGTIPLVVAPGVTPSVKTAEKQSGVALQANAEADKQAGQKIGEMGAKLPDGQSDAYKEGWQAGHEQWLANHPKPAVVSGASPAVELDDSKLKITHTEIYKEKGDDISEEDKILKKGEMVWFDLGFEILTDNKMTVGSWRRIDLPDTFNFSDQINKKIAVYADDDVKKENPYANLTFHKDEATNKLYALLTFEETAVGQSHVKGQFQFQGKLASTEADGSVADIKPFQEGSEVVSNLANFGQPYRVEKISTGFTEDSESGDFTAHWQILANANQLTLPEGTLIKDIVGNDQTLIKGDVYAFKQVPAIKTDAKGHDIYDIGDKTPIAHLTEANPTYQLTAKSSKVYVIDVDTLIKRDKISFTNGMTKDVTNTAALTAGWKTVQDEAKTSLNYGKENQVLTKTGTKPFTIGDKKYIQWTVKLAPHGRAITVLSDTLKIDGHQVNAPWYLPDSFDKPTKVEPVGEDFEVNLTKNPGETMTLKRSDAGASVRLTTSDGAPITQPVDFTYLTEVTDPDASYMNRIDVGTKNATYVGSNSNNGEAINTSGIAQTTSIDKKPLKLQPDNTLNYLVTLNKSGARLHGSDLQFADYMTNAKMTANQLEAVKVVRLSRATYQEQYEKLDEAQQFEQAQALTGLKRGQAVGQYQLTANPTGDAFGLYFNLGEKKSRDVFLILYSVTPVNNEDLTSGEIENYANWDAKEQGKVSAGSNEKPIKYSYRDSVTNMIKSGNPDYSNHTIKWNVFVDTPEAAEGATMNDTLPKGITYKPGSLSILAGGTKRYHASATEQDGQYPLLDVKNHPVEGAFLKVIAGTDGQRFKVVMPAKEKARSYVFSYATDVSQSGKSAINDSFRNDARYADNQYFGTANDTVNYNDLERIVKKEETGTWVDAKGKNPNNRSFTVTVNEAGKKINHLLVKDRMDDGLVSLLLIQSSLKVYEQGDDGKYTDITGNDAYTATTTDRGFDLKWKEEVTRPIKITYDVQGQLQAGSTKMTTRNNVTVSGDEIGSQNSAGSEVVVVQVEGGSVEGKVGSVTIKKKDAISREALAGARFELIRQSDGQVIQPRVKEGDKYFLPVGHTEGEPTKEFGMLTFKSVRYGTYLLHEVKAPDGYAVNPTDTVVVVGDETPNPMVTITNQPLVKKTKLTGEKHWQGGSPAKRQEVELTLYNGADPVMQDGRPVTTTTSAEKQWKYQFNDLPVSVDGHPANYRVVETNFSTMFSPDYGPVTIDDGGKQFYQDVTNIAVPDQTITGQKVWIGDEKVTDQRPTSVRVGLYRTTRANPKPELVGTQDVSAATNWRYTFTKVKRADSAGNDYHYTVQELNVDPNYQEKVIGYTIFNVYKPHNEVPPTPETTELTVTKQWVGDEDHLKDRPKTVHVQLNQNGKQYDEVDLSAANAWSHTFTGLPKQDAEGDNYDYTVVETDVPAHYQASYSADHVITNTYTPDEDEPPAPGQVRVEGTKQWVGDDANLDMRPATITVQLSRESLNHVKEVVATTTTSAAQNWQYSFGDLPQLDEAGEAYTYTVEELDVPSGYLSSVDGYNITNTYLPTEPWYPHEPDTPGDSKTPNEPEEPEYPVLPWYPEEKLPEEKHPEDKQPEGKTPDTTEHLPATGDAQSAVSALAGLLIIMAVAAGAAWRKRAAR